MARNEVFIPEQYYHIYSRVIFNRPEFKNKKNAEKLALNFWVANSTESDSVFRYLRNTKHVTQGEITDLLDKGERLVDVVCYCIMPDHYHLLLREKTEGGISTFLHKSNTSVAKYINIKNERKGPLFESRFKAKHVDDNQYLLHLSVYIHLNPLDFLVGREWRKHGLINWDISRTKLLDYPWSSLGAFLDKDSRDVILSGTDVVTEQFRGDCDYERFLREWSEVELELEL